MTQIVAIPLLLWAVWKLLRGDAGSVPKLSVALAALVVFLPLAQLLPLPKLTADGSVGRQLQDEALAMAGLALSSGVTVAVDATVLSLVSLLPAIAIFLATLVLRQRERRWLAFIVIGFAFLSVLLGLMQISQGVGSPLRFYAITNPEDAVGFFANRNHFSALLNCGLVLSSGCLAIAASHAGFDARVGPRRQAAIIAGFTLVVALLAAQGMARSRAGVSLALVALLLAFAMMAGLVRARDAKANPVRTMAITVGLGMMLAIQYGTVRTVERFDIDAMQDARVSFAKNTFEAVLSFLPFGSGLGTFTHIYPSFERLETALVSTYVNRAHNDVVEYALEGGVLSMFIMLAAMLALIGRAASLWQPGRAVTLDLMLQRSAACVLLLMLLHSVFDYPLRTTAMLAVFAVCAGLLLARHDLACPRDEANVDPTSADVQATLMGQRATPPIAATRRWGHDIDWPEAWKTHATGPDGKGPETEKSSA